MSARKARTEAAAASAAPVDSEEKDVKIPVEAVDDTEANEAAAAEAAENQVEDSNKEATMPEDEMVEAAISAGEEAADYLYEMGHRRIAYFGVSNAMLFSAERKRGYQMSLLKHGITPREEDCVEIDALNDAYEETLKTLFTAPDRPTAMLVSDDILAVVLEQFCGKLGLRVPKDLSIVSFNNSLFSRITSPQLTTVDVNPYQLGMEAASQTINHIENPNLLATKIIVPHRLIQRESCCPPPEI